MTSKISHNADRLPNGNTIFVWGFPDQIDDAQVTEVNSEGVIENTNIKAALDPKINQIDVDFSV
ncbi:hypothetical protein ACFLX0_03595 [Chloroflexota bacterium]